MSPEETLKRYWGYDGFRPLQREIVGSVLSGRDTLGLMPTGGGKSVTFQVPGMMAAGLTIVVTPLISLMKDQVDNLRRRQIKAVALHSGLTHAERRVAMEKIVNGGAKFLYISPERIANKDFMATVRRLDVSLIVVDEAHCISQWGYDFRPSYLNIRELRTVKPGVPVLALTATATPEVADDICRRLGMKGEQRFRMSFARPNISYVVRHTEGKEQEALHILRSTGGSGILYVRSRRRAAETAKYLIGAGISADYYHAGLPYEEKEKRQNAWKQGAVRVIVATNAFGMGIDKPDVRVVIHTDIPPSLEEYYQEAGRAGRDGKPSYAVLLVSKRDSGVMRRRVTEAFPPREYIRKVYERVCNTAALGIGEGCDALMDFDIEKFCATFGYSERQCRSALHILGQAGYVEFMEEVDRRSKVMFLCDRNELYRLQGLGKEAEKVMELMLRAYPGLFTEFQTISEGELCRAGNLTERQVYQSLLELARCKVIHFVPRSRKPMVYFPTSREEPKYIAIGKAIYEDKLERLKNRTEAMISYAYCDKGCRENAMLAYFGEQREEDECGLCDICRKKKKQGQTANLGSDISRVKQALEKAGGALPYAGLRIAVPMAKDSLDAAVAYMLQEGMARAELTTIVLIPE